MRRLLHRSILALAAPTLLCAAASAQTALAVTWTGDAVVADITNGTVTPLGATGLTSVNSLAKLGASFYVTGRDPNLAGESLALIDATTGQATSVIVTTMTSVRGLAFDDQDVLFAIENASPDRLMRLDPVTGVATLVGSTGFGGIQALEFFDGQLYAWDCLQGLAVVDRVTGAATNVNGAQDGNCSIVQTLFADGAGNLLAMSDSVYVVDVVSGTLSQLALSGAGDVRGAAVQFIPPILGTPDQISLAAGGTQTITMTPGSEHAGRFCLLLGTVSGTAPGILVEGKTLPLNVDIYFLSTLTSPNVPPLAGSFTTLDAFGAATASFTLPPLTNPALAGLSANHAYVVLDLQPTLLSVPFVSPALAVELAP